MQLELRVRHRARTRTVTIDCPPGTTWGRVAPDLLARLGLPPQLVCRTAGHPLDHDAVLGVPPLLRCSEIDLGPAVGAAPGLREASLELAVVGGPCAGLLLPLREGDLVLGRDPSCDLVVDDDALSRRHAVLSVDDRGVQVTDTSSTNGTTIDGAPVVGPHPIALGAGIRLGDSLVVVQRVRPPAPERPAGDGHLLVQVAPPRQLAWREQVLTVPGPPDAPRGSPFPWLTMVLPLVAAGVLALVLRSPVFLALALLGPVMVLGTHLTDRRRRRQDARASALTHDESLARLDRDLAAALAQAREAAEQRTVDPASALTAARRRGGRLWQDGRPDELRVRVGRATVPGPVLLRDADGHDRRPLVEHVPVEIDLLDAGLTAIVGRDAARVATAVAGCLAARCSPETLAVTVVTSSRRAAERWEWVRRLPHPTSVMAAQDAGEAVTRLTHEHSSSEHDGAAHLVVVLDPATPASAAVLDRLAPLATAGSGLAILAVSTDAAGIPDAARAWVRQDGDRALVRLPSGMEVPGVVPDRAAQGWEAQLASGLAPLRPVHGRGGTQRLPVRVALDDVLPSDLSTAGLDEHWGRPGRRPVATLGLDGQGPVTLDLVTDGPHVLVGGTTGAGKSELLQTLVATLAVALPPAELAFLLVDYKGGAAFGACTALPHTTGLVTDLDPHLSRRALASLRAELRRREVLLRQAGASDLDGYLSRRGPGDADLPRLVIVVDEFRMLAQELPDFVDGLLAVATIGRSLGVHLVLATQRPAGVVTPDIRANVNARIALRVRDRADSQDVLEAPDAAWISDRTPGRAVWRGGDTMLRPLQVAWAGAPAESAADPVTIDIEGLPCDGPPAVAETQLQRLVGRVAEAARDRPRPRAAWLPVLPATIAAPSLPVDRDARTATVGVVDLPEEQTQEPALLDLGSGRHLAVVGTHRTGRTTALRTIALRASLAGSADLHLHVVDGGGALGDLEDLPTCGTRVTRDDPQGALRLLDRLAHEPPAGTRTLLLVDRWDALVTGVDARLATTLQDSLVGVLRDGPGAGVVVVLAGDRTVLTSSLASHLGDRWVLRVADPADLALCGVPAVAAPDHQPPGRAIRLPDGAEMQLARTTPDDVRTLAPSVAPPRVAPLRLRTLPSVVDPTPLLACRPPAFALGGDAAAGVSLAWGSHPVMVVAGPPGSGRTTALRALAAAAAVPREDVVLVTPGSGIRPPEATVSLGPDDADALRDFLVAHPEALVLVDDADLLLDSPVEQVCIEAARAALARGGAPGPTVVAAGTTDRLGATYRGLPALLRRAATGLVLQPRHPSDGDLLGAQVPWLHAPPPGRGVLVHRGRTLVVQVARMPSPAATSSDPPDRGQGTIIG